MLKATFSAILRKKIKEAGYTQEDFANAVGISLASLKKYLSDAYQTVPDIETLDSMCTVLHCDADFLMGRMEYKSHNSRTVSEITGLSENSVDNLLKLRNDNLEVFQSLDLALTLYQEAASLFRSVANYRLLHHIPVSCDNPTALLDIEYSAKAEQYQAAINLSSLLSEAAKTSPDAEWLIDYYIKAYKQKYNKLPNLDGSFDEQLAKIKKALTEC